MNFNYLYIQQSSNEHLFESKPYMHVMQIKTAFKNHIFKMNIYFRISYEILLALCKSCFHKEQTDVVTS
jgi:hypothetical protein